MIVRCRKFSLLLLRQFFIKSFRNSPIQSHRRLLQLRFGQSVIDQKKGKVKNLLTYVPPKKLVKSVEGAAHVLLLSLHQPNNRVAIKRELKGFLSFSLSISLTHTNRFILLAFHLKTREMQKYSLFSSSVNERPTVSSLKRYLSN